MTADRETGAFLPNFCAQGNLLRTIVAAELLVFVLVAVRPGDLSSRLEALALLSFFVQWIALVDLLLLCSGRHLLARLDDRIAASIAFVLLQLVTAAFTILAYYLLQTTAGVPPATPLSEALLENTVVSAIVTAVALRYFYVTAEWRRKVEAFAQARVQALQARIRPHFLFNSMNTIASLTRSSPDTAERAVEDLSELFRASLSDRSLLDLTEELELAHSYLRIEQERLGDRLQVEWDLDPAAGTASLPALSLQPLVENAVYHGIEPLAEGGTVRIETHAHEDRVEIRITNPVAAAGRVHAGHRMAQDNVRQRLAYAYDDAATLQSESVGGQYRICIRVPASGKEPA